MNDKRYQWILYTIVFVIASTIAIQVFWNYKNYQTNKQQVFNDIQWSLDNAVETYYTEISKENFLAIVNSTHTEDNIGFNFSHVAWDTLLNPFNHDSLKLTHKPEQKISITSIDISTDDASEFDSINSVLFNEVFDKNDELLNKKLGSKKSIKSKRFTQLSKNKKNGLTFDKDSLTVTTNKVFWGKKASDSLKLIKGLSTVFIAMQQDSLDYKKLDSIVVTELNNKGVLNDFYVSHYKNGDLIYSSKKENQPQFHLKREAKATYLKSDERISLSFKDPVTETFKRSLLGISLSTLLILTVISCLFYLLKIITRQKQLSEVKNDLISNITHEFKTPIATIGVALESIKDFNIIDDKEKTKRYLDMSNNQLSKLNLMVEKLLETATLDSDNLKLQKQDCNISDLLNLIIEKHNIQANNKSIKYNPPQNTVIAHVDEFHFENAANNIIDNAIKYGGNEITVSLEQNPFAFTVSISDNGNNITKANKDKIFEKFYRIPKGNTHDIKGFGIGLYYTKTIVEKHEGNIYLDLSNNLTTFKITLPNG
ncbi:sensor histidine kinase [Ichthyenterobacterium magnum]|uniref:histidine kinase n=1 Tax=Ichthyenterobacterium magnum TaxID=1230530 RepID=A0A420DFQ2_9FLAO|nr:HAMP domain-containing sensor histidine kinase [Ichthyenterobacterium magnum]RKE91936.1 two-component system phosphate regulon sensor histidine kinase PhoR [Ichthyenterobacterium magnum]